MLTVSLSSMLKVTGLLLSTLTGCLGCVKLALSSCSVKVVGLILMDLSSISSSSSSIGLAFSGLNLLGF